MPNIGNIVLKNGKNEDVTFTPVRPHQGPDSPAEWQAKTGTNRLDVTRIKLYCGTTQGGGSRVGFIISKPTVVIDPIKGPVVAARQTFDSTKGGQGYLLSPGATDDEIADISAFTRGFGSHQVVWEAINGLYQF